MRTVDDTLTFRNLVYAIYENCTLLLQFFHHEPVMDNFLAHINWTPKSLERDPDDIDRSHHPGAKSTRLQKQQSLCVQILSLSQAASPTHIG